MKPQLKFKAIILRGQGYSMKEIADLLKVSKSTASLWVRGVELNNEALLRLKKRCDEGRDRSQKIQKEKRVIILNEIVNKNKNLLSNIDKSNALNKIFCSLLHWCEGAKCDQSLRFINSDPKMVRTFLYLLRSSFDIDETKFRACLHLHQYHDDETQKKFWSNITNIPLSQFLKIYRKSNTGERYRKNYPGCLSLRYHDHKIAKELNSLWKLFGEKYK